MNFNPHYDLEGKHAFLSPSQHSWLRYSEEKLKDRWQTARAAEEGTELHDIACKCIRKKLKLQRTRQTINMYVNDAIGFGMIPEQVLYYSEYCFGTADTILYSEKNKFLRIHDLKTGSSPVSMDQLRVYDALFFLEYGGRLGITPFNVSIENRIYQNNEVIVDNPDPNDIQTIMDIIVKDDYILRKQEGKC